MGKEEVVEKMVEYIEGLQDGEGDTTARILEKLFPEYIDEGTNMMKSHNEVFNRVKKNGKIIMDYSEYENMDVGLPYNLIFRIIRK